MLHTVPAPDVRMRTLLAVEEVLRESGEPMSRNQVLRRLADRSRSTTRQKLNVVLGYLGAHGMTAEASRGVQWVASRDPRLLDAIRSGVRVR